jgi:hypothetical protein
MMGAESMDEQHHRKESTIYFINNISHEDCFEVNTF